MYFLNLRLLSLTSTYGFVIDEEARLAPAENIKATKHTISSNLL